MKFRSEETNPRYFSPLGRWFGENFYLHEENLNGEKGSPLHSGRKRSFQEFLEAGFPNAKHEEWKYTDPRRLLDGDWQVERYLGGKSEAITTALERTLGFSVINELESFRFIVGVGGSLLSSPSAETLEREGVSLSLADYTSDLNWRSSTEKLSNLFPNKRLVLRVLQGRKVATPIEVIYVAGIGIHNTALLESSSISLTLEAQSSATIIENFVADDKSTIAKYLRLRSTSISLGEGAQLTHYLVQRESAVGAHLGSLRVNQGAESRFTSCIVSLGGLVTRNEIEFAIEGEGANTQLFGISLLSGEQHLDHTTFLEHQVPNCLSEQVYKGIYSGSSFGAFSGTIIVHPHAQKTQAIQSNQSIALSDTAKVRTRPQLKIWADDVKCTHGATIGQLDDDSIAYIRARGIDYTDARAILLQAFMLEVFGRLPDQAMATTLAGIAAAKLSKL